MAFTTTRQKRKFSEISNGSNEYKIANSNHCNISHIHTDYIDSNNEDLCYDRMIVFGYIHDQFNKHQESKPINCEMSAMRIFADDICNLIFTYDSTENAIQQTFPLYLLSDCTIDYNYPY